MAIWTEERAEALSRLVQAVEIWGQTPGLKDNSPEEEEVFNALMDVRRTGADIALSMPTPKQTPI
ncbi:MAG: hypothetical protein WAM53_04355 [Terrimicrobiaceae bacterium]